jgi:hypothetical protein
MGGERLVELAHGRLEVATDRGQEPADPRPDSARPGIIPARNPSGYGFRVTEAIDRSSASTSSPSQRIRPA